MPASVWNSAHRALPSIVPPRCRILPTSRGPSGMKSCLINPAKPCRTPKTSAPWKRARRVTARIAAFMPGASPPLVRSAIRFISAPINDRQFANRAQQLPGRPH